jgi:CRISPR/Cas system CMR-associated protein Cmr5 small subunit
MATETLEQKRARHALGQIQKLEGGKPEDLADIRAALESIGSLLTVNGLIPVLIKYNKDLPKVAEILQSWLSTSEFGLNLKKDGDLARTLVLSNAQTYRLATLESLAYTRWLKEWAQATMPKRSDLPEPAKPEAKPAS